MEDIKFTLPDSYPLEDLRRTQARLLEMAIIVKKILENHNIPYFLSSGTLIGAVRHGEFIPWDDDCDLYLFEDSYEEAIRFLGQEVPEDMFVEYHGTEPNYFHDWGHVKDINSIVTCSQYPQDSLYSHKGISIDLYKMSMMRESEWPKFKYERAIEYLERRMKYGFIDESEYEDKKKMFYNQYIDRVTNGNYTDKLVFGSSVSKHIFKYDDILPLSEIKLNGVTFRSPHNFDGFLKEIYGDYMSLPSMEQRVPHCSSVKFL